MTENPQTGCFKVFKHKLLSKCLLDDKYLLGSEIIGSGSTCEVFKGVNLKNCKTVAIKKIRNQQKDFHKRMNFQKEISILKSLRHPNIIKLEEVVYIKTKDKKQLYMVFEYLPLTLRQILMSRQNLTEVQVKNIIIKILKGLKYLQKNNVLHRDLKPENILLSQDFETVKICDFGLSRVYNPKNKENQKELSHHVMTRWYRAPQVILLLSQYSSKVDIWSLGCVFGQLIQTILPKYNQKKKVLFCGRACFPLSPPPQNIEVSYTMKNGFPHSSKDQLFKILQVLGTPQNVQFISGDNGRSLQYLNSFSRKKKSRFSQILQGIPKWSQDLLNKLLQFNPNDRFSASEAIQFLQQVFQQKSLIEEMEQNRQQRQNRSWIQKICSNT